MPRDARHRGREAALQLLYHWEVGRLEDAGLDEAVRSFWEAHPAPAESRELAARLIGGTIAHVAEADALIAESAEHWRLSRMAVLDRLILRLAVYEFCHTETPKAVVIDEALELAKTFSGEQSAAFVNGVLDAIRRRLDEEPGR